MLKMIEELVLLAAFDVPVTDDPWTMLCLDDDGAKVTEADFYRWRGEAAAQAGWL